MRVRQVMMKWFESYKELCFFLLFTLLCVCEAAGKGALNEFGNIEFWLMLSCVILLIGAEQLKANKKLLMAVFMLATVGNLIHACQEVYYFHADELRQAGEAVTVMDYKSVSTDYILGLAAVLAVLVLYPRLYKILSNDFAVFGMAVLTFAIYGLLLAGGQSVGGVRAWFHGIQLTEFVKILFVFVIAGLLSKKQSFVRSGLAVLYMCGNVVCLGIISEYGTLIVMGIVFLIFLFIFPNKLWWLGGVLLTGTIAMILLFSAGTGIYNEALENSPSAKFAEQFVENIQAVTNDDGETVSGMDAVKQMAEEAKKVYEAKDKEAETAKNTNAKALSAEELEKRKNYEAALQKLTDGSVEKVDTELLTALAENQEFRSNFIDTFCKNKFWGDKADTLYEETGHGIIHKVKEVTLKMYNKCVARLILPMLPEKLQEKLLGLKAVDTSDETYQTGEAAKAMRLGGLTGAGAHEFIDVIYMQSDMVFSSVVSFFGFAMGAFVILMYMIMFREGIRIQRELETAPFHQGVALGMILMLFIQAMYIIGGNLGAFPLTGITLPFIADGGISLLICFIMVGLLMTISFMSVTEQNVQADNKFRALWLFLGGMLKKTVHDSRKGIVKGVGKIGKIVMADIERADDDIEEAEDEVFGDAADAHKDEASSNMTDTYEDITLDDFADTYEGKNFDGHADTKVHKSCDDMANMTDENASEAVENIYNSRTVRYAVHDDTKDVRMRSTKSEKGNTIFDRWTEEEEDDDDL